MIAPLYLAEIAQLVEHQLPKLRVAGSSPVFRSSLYLYLFLFAESPKEPIFLRFFLFRFSFHLPLQNLLTTNLFADNEIQPQRLLGKTNFGTRRRNGYDDPTL